MKLDQPVVPSLGGHDGKVKLWLNLNILKWCKHVERAQWNIFYKTFFSEDKNRWSGNIFLFITVLCTVKGAVMFCETKAAVLVCALKYSTFHFLKLHFYNFLSANRSIFTIMWLECIIFGQDFTPGNVF